MAKKADKNKLVNGGNLNLVPEKKVEAKVPTKAAAIKAIGVIESTGLMGASELRSLTLRVSRTLKDKAPKAKAKAPKAKAKAPKAKAKAPKDEKK